MNKLVKNMVQFDYFSSNYEKFEKDFYNYTNFDIPLTFLTDDILKFMFFTKKNYFRLDANKSKDNKTHYFIFNEHPHKDNKNVKIYEYSHHCYNLDEI